MVNHGNNTKCLINATKHHTKISAKTTSSPRQGWKLKPKPKPENPVLKNILETQTETDTYSAKILKT